MWKKVIIKLAFEAVVKILIEVAKKKGRYNVAESIQELANEVKL